MDFEVDHAKIGHAQIELQVFSKIYRHTFILLFPFGFLSILNPGYDPKGGARTGRKNFAGSPQDLADHAGSRN